MSEDIFKLLNNHSMSGIEHQATYGTGGYDKDGKS